METSRREIKAFRQSNLKGHKNTTVVETVESFNNCLSIVVAQWDISLVGRENVSQLSRLSATELLMRK